MRYQYILAALLFGSGLKKSIASCAGLRYDGRKAVIG